MSKANSVTFTTCSRHSPDRQGDPSENWQAGYNSYCMSNAFVSYSSIEFSRLLREGQVFVRESHPLSLRSSTFPGCSGNSSLVVQCYPSWWLWCDACAGMNGASYGAKRKSSYGLTLLPFPTNGSDRDINQCWRFYAHFRHRCKAVRFLRRLLHTCTGPKHNLQRAALSIDHHSAVMLITGRI